MSIYINTENKNFAWDDVTVGQAQLGNSISLVFSFGWLDGSIN